MIYPTLFVMVLLVIAQVPTVTVMTDRGFYAPGDQVRIQVTASGLQDNETLWLYIDKPDRHNLNYTELPACGGTFNVTLPQDAPEGSYTVTVMWDHRYVETGFIVETRPIPEFPVTPLVLMIAIAIATLAILGRQASSPAKTPAAYS
jgi:hypothetical protein